jgi:tripartite motif-containing protein 71
VFTPDGKFIRKFGSSGGGDGNLSSPADVSVDYRGYAVVADRYPFSTLICDLILTDFRGNSRVCVFDNEGKFVRHVASAGAGKGQFGSPWSATVDKDGKIVVAYVLPVTPTQLTPLK